jgi:hypothetical protein
MARTQIETKFAQALGRIGEEQIAIDLLPKMGVTEFWNLNRGHNNHPWADYGGYRNGECVAIAVRTRVNWQKPPRNGSSPRLRDGFGGAGQRKADKACRLIRSDLGLPEAASIHLLWLAIAVDLDNTYEAYWGYREEMRPRANGDDHLTIRMKATDRAGYANQGRRLAWRQPCVIPWEEFPDEWACPARARYLMLNSDWDRDRRIDAAIRGIAPITGHPPRLRHPKDSIPHLDCLAVTGSNAPGGDLPNAVTSLSCPKDVHEQQVASVFVQRDSARANTTVVQQSIESLLESCANLDEKEFFRSRLAQGQPTTEIGLKYCVSGRSRWCVDIHQKWARVVQKGRFAGDEDFWRLCLSALAREFVGTKRSGKYLTFRLIAATDFASFQNVIDNESASFRWLGFDPPAEDSYTAERIELVR